MLSDMTHALLGAFSLHFISQINYMHTNLCLSLCFWGSPNEETAVGVSLISVNGALCTQLLESRPLGIFLDFPLSQY